MSITSHPIAGPPQTAKAAGQPPRGSAGHHVSAVVIGLAVATRIMRDPRTQEAVIMAVIAVVAARGLGKASRTKSFERLAAWDKRRAANELRKLKPGKPSG